MAAEVEVEVAILAAVAELAEVEPEAAEAGAAGRVEVALEAEAREDLEARVGLAAGGEDPVELAAPAVAAAATILIRIRSTPL